MFSNTILMGPNYLFVCYFLWESAFPVTGNKTSVSNEFTNEQSLNSISERIHSGNRTTEWKNNFMSIGNSTENETQKYDENQLEHDNNTDRVIQDSNHTFINSIVIKNIEDSNRTESNLLNNSSDKSTNKSNRIELTTIENRNMTNTMTSITSSHVVKGSTQYTTDIKHFHSDSGYASTTELSVKTDSSEKKHNEKKPILTYKTKHKILKHLNLVPIEDEPFGGVLWRDDSKYVMSICVPIAVGIVGAACIIGMAYAARRCYKNERKIQEIRAALQAQISSNRNDETVLLESSDEE